MDRVFPVGVRTCKRPKMTLHRGRCWDVCDVILPQELGTIKGHYDTTWGENVYFEFCVLWWRVRIAEYDHGPHTHVEIDLTKARHKL